MVPQAAQQDLGGSGGAPAACEYFLPARCVQEQPGREEQSDPEQGREAVQPAGRPPERTAHRGPAGGQPGAPRAAAHGRGASWGRSWSFENSP